ncbi:MAG: dienelactone hydrolase family protein [Candidatus Limnocylindrales bacterium]
MGEMVRFPSNGGWSDGYLARPRSGTGPGVLVIQEWWGLNDQIKGVCHRFAGEGFNALAPDLYKGKHAGFDEPDDARKLMMQLDLAEVAKVARGAAAFLAAHENTSSTKVGIIGFCMGGMLALLAGTVAPQIGAIADCYGVPPRQKPDYAAMRGVPVIGIFGGKDHVLEAVPALEADLAAAGVPFTKHVYPDADHGFLNDQRADAYRADDAKDAWSKIIPFLRDHLAP